MFSNCISAVINALKRLQNKISKLEIDKVRAEENLKALATEANDYKTILQKEHEFSESAQSAIEIQKRGIDILNLSFNFIFYFLWNLIPHCITKFE